MDRRVRNYITEHKEAKSRYDIDKHLLRTGHSAREIEAIWDEFLKPLPPQPFLKHRTTKIAALFFSFLLLGISFYFWHYPDDPAIGDIETNLRFWTLAFQISFFIFLIFWIKHKKYNPHAESLALIISLIIAGIAVFSSFGSIIEYDYKVSFFTKSVSHLTVKDYDYRLNVRTGVCSDYNCTTELTVSKCNTHASCSEYKTFVDDATGQAALKGQVVFEYNGLINQVLLVDVTIQKILYSMDAS